MAARFSTVRVKANRAYTVEEAAELVGATEATIRRWFKAGLRALTESRPALVLGSDLKAYLSSRDETRRQRLASGQLFCLGCKAPTTPALGEVEHAHISDGRSLIKALCPVCTAVCSRIISTADLPDYARMYQIAENGAPRP